MSDWEVLGIAPTRDAGEIRKAYATRLKAIKRDLDPHAFQELREAYERALSGCDNPDMAPPRPVPPPRSSFANAGAAPAPVRVVATPPVQRGKRTRWRDIAIDGAEPPAHEAPRPEQAPRQDDRTRIDAALDALREILKSGSAQQAAAGFQEIVGRIAHPVDGVSIAALAGFERAVIDIVSEGMRAGDPTAVAVARAAAEHFRWSERTRDVRGDLDPRTFAFAGFTVAEEIERAARMSHLHRSPVDEAFAVDLVGPLDLKRFAKAIAKREGYDARREQWSYLLATEGNPVAWLPAANVAWWRRALAEPRLFPGSVGKAVTVTCLAILPFIAALFGRTFPLLIAGLPVLLGATWLVLYHVASRQDEPAYAFLLPAWRFAAKVTRLLDASREIPGNVLSVRSHVVYPILFAFFMAGFWETLKEPAAIKGPAALLVDFLGWVVVVYVWLAVWGLYRLGNEYFERFKRRPLRDKVIAGSVTAVLGASALAAIIAGLSGESYRGAGVVALWWGGSVAAVVLVSWGLRAAILRLPERLRALSWVVVFIAIVSALVFVANVKDHGAREALFAAGGAAMFVAVMGAILAGLAWLGSIGERLKSFEIWGLGYRDLLVAAMWGAVATVLANDYLGFAGACGLGAVVLVANLVHSGWAARRKARAAAPPGPG